MKYELKTNKHIDVNGERIIIDLSINSALQRLLKENCVLTESAIIDFTLDGFSSIHERYKVKTLTTNVYTWTSLNYILFAKNLIDKKKLILTATNERAYNRFKECITQLKQFIEDIQRINQTESLNIVYETTKEIKRETSQNEQ